MYMVLCFVLVWQASPRMLYVDFLLTATVPRGMHALIEPGRHHSQFLGNRGYRSLLDWTKTLPI